MLADHHGEFRISDFGFRIFRHPPKANEELGISAPSPFRILDFSAAPCDGFNRVATEGRQQPPTCHLDRGPKGPEWRDL